MKIWRCEDGKKQGPYTQTIPWKRPDFLQKDDSAHPRPSEDLLPEGYDMGSHCYGFSSFKQLDDWFTAENRQWLRDNGFRILILETENGCDVKIGGRQLAFRRDHAEIIEEELR